MLDGFLARLPRRGRWPLLGKVTLLEEIGRGGMGVVHAGWHQTLDLPVAVKLLQLPTSPIDPDLEARFQREARIAAELDEPNLLRVLDLGKEAGIPYLVMEWIPGRSLDEVVRAAGPLSEAEVSTVLRDVGQALLALHRRGIVHRDLKPQNLLLRARDGRVKVADLGLAIDTAATRQGLTQGILGTPAYMSPEQIRDSSSVGPASDLFSLGATAFTLLTGQSPFAGTSVWEVLSKVASAPLPELTPPRGELSPALRELIAALTMKDPASRIGSAEELLRRLPPISLPFRDQTLAAARPLREILRPVAWDQDSPAAAIQVEETLAAPTPSATEETAAHARTAAGLAPASPPRALLLCQCLQHDFLSPGASDAPLPNRLHVGWSEARRLLGEDPARGPLLRAVEACAGAERVRIIHIRDWHDLADPQQRAELDHFGEHCLMGTPGARFIDAIERYSRDRRRSAVVDSTGLNDFEDTPLAEVIATMLEGAPRDRVPVGVIGVWTNVKVQYLLYELRTRARFSRLATCSALTAAPDRVAHRQTLQHLEDVGVQVFHEVDDFLGFLGVAQPRVREA